MKTRIISWIARALGVTVYIDGVRWGASLREAGRDSR